MIDKNKASITCLIKAILGFRNKLLTVFILIFCSYSGFAQISRIQVISNAGAYVNYLWTANDTNIWQNINCTPIGNILTPVWVKVDTINTGIPYCWGGWSSITSFATGISNGKSAGDKDCTTSGDLVEKCAVGVDCSGLVTNAWGITSQKYSTSTLLNISKSIALSAVQPGDILNWPYHHTRLVYENNITTTGYIDVIESSSIDWKVAKHSYKPSALTSYDPRCANSSIIIDSTTSVLSYTGNSAGIIIYPNPTTGLLNIKSTGSENDHYKITLTNTSGQILIDKEFKPMNKLLETQFDIKGLSSGIYFLTINSTKTNQVFKVQKQ